MQGDARGLLELFIEFCVGAWMLSLQDDKCGREQIEGGVVAICYPAPRDFRTKKNSGPVKGAKSSGDASRRVIAQLNG